MTEERLKINARNAKLDELLPEWAHRAACAELYNDTRAPAEPMFADDVATKRVIDWSVYPWPQRTRDAMRVCAGCPVRIECLAYAFEAEKRESRDWWTGEWEPLDRRYGVYGGVPGRVREWFADTPNPEVACDDWFRKFAAKKRWSVDLDREETLTA